MSDEQEAILRVARNKILAAAKREEESPRYNAYLNSVAIINAMLENDGRLKEGELV